MRLLITGASGFIGNHVLHSLAMEKIDVLAIGRKKPISINESSFVQVDLLNHVEVQSCLHKLGATHLLHLAWVTEHSHFWSSPLNFDWVAASAHLVSAFAAAGGKHVVAAGSCAEYGWTHGLCSEYLTPLVPTTTYGIAKDATRRLLMSLCKSENLSCAWGRIFLTHGHGEDPRRLVPAVIEALSGMRPTFGVHRSAWRDFLHVSDVAEGLVTLLRLGVPGEFNISSGNPVQIEQLIRLIGEQLNLDPEPLLGLEPPISIDSPNILLGDNRRLQALGWQAQHSLQSGLSQTINSRSFPKVAISQI